MNRRTTIAIAAATLTTLGTGAVTAAAMSGTDVLGLSRDYTPLELVAPTTTTDDNSPTSTRSDTRRSSDDTSTSTSSSTTAPTTTRSTDDNPNRSSSTTTRTTTPTPVNPTSNTATFRSVGGEVDVTWNARTLTIVAVRPAAGYRAENQGGDGDEVEAEFESAAHNSKITVRLVNGAPSVSVRERDDDNDRSDDNSSDDNRGPGGGTDDNSNSGRGSEGNDDHGGSGRG